MRLLPDTLRATPPMTKDMASVAISGLILRNATIIPLTMPTTETDEQRHADGDLR